MSGAAAVRGHADRSVATEGDGPDVRRVLGGDRDHYAVLVRRYQERLYAHARRVGLDHDTALDLVQDALVRAYGRLDSCEDPDRFGSWIHRILRNLCLDHLRDIRRKVVPLDSVGPVVDGARPDRDTERGELAEHLELALSELPVEMREAFLQRHREGWSYSRMAEVAEISLSAAKMRVHRAREALRDSLAAVGGLA